MKKRYTNILNKLLILIIVILSSTNYSHSQSPKSQWINGFGGSASDIGYGVDVDNNNNSYVTGYFSGTLNLGNEVNAISNGGQDAFIIKYDTDGKALWAKTIGGSGEEFARGIATDKNGNSVVIGYFMSQSIDFGNGVTIINHGNKDAFIAKYNNEGTCLWAVAMGGTAWDFGYSTSIDLNGNIYVSGEYYETASFGSGIIITSTGRRDIFLAKYSSTGVCLWAKTAGGDWVDHGNSISVDRDGNSYITGYFEDMAYFDTIQVSCLGQSDFFLAKYNPNGECQWVKTTGYTLDDYGKSVYTDLDGNCFIVGTFYETVDYDFGISLVSNGEHDIFIAKYNTDGLCEWAHSVGGTLDDAAYAVTVDTTGNSYIAGHFGNDIDFGNNIRLSSNGGSDIMIAKYDVDGECLWASNAGGQGKDCAFGFCLDNQNSCIITGFYNNDATFDGNTVPGFGNDDIFIAKYSVGGVISGTISLESGTIPTNSISVYLYKKDDIYIHQEKIVDLDSNSNYVFDNLVEGEYYIGARLLNTGVLPNTLSTYYGNASSWNEARNVQVTAGDSIDANIKMIQLKPNNHGRGAIRGRIFFATNTKSILGEPVTGVEVIIIEDTNAEEVEEVGESITDINGGYGFDNLADGRYHLLVDIPGNDTTPGIPQIETYNFPISYFDSLYTNMNFIVDTFSSRMGIYIDSSTSPTHYINDKFSVHVYPNPFKDEIKLNYYLEKTSNINIDVIDSYGRVVKYVIDKEQIKGSYIYSVDIKNKAPGTYVIRLKIDDDTYVKKVVKLKNN